MRMLVAGASALVVLAGCGSSTTPEAGSGTVAGRVLSAPSCPVEQAGNPCPPRPVVGATVDALRNDDVVASTHSGAAGRFRLHLPPGRYVIRATNAGALRTTAQKQVMVGTKQGRFVRLVVDSGIR